MAERAALGVRVWACGVCGKHGQWGPGWFVFGSICDEEDDKPVLVVCSFACRSKSKEGKEGKEGNFRPVHESFYHSLPAKDGGGELVRVQPGRFHYHARLPRTVAPDGAGEVAP